MYFTIFAAVWAVICSISDGDGAVGIRETAENGSAVFSIYSIFCLGRSVSIMAEARRLVTHGPYARIRHPLYLGEEIVLLGITLEFISPWAVALLICQWAFQMRRMSYEELVLKGAFPEYETYMARTARLIPGFY